MTCEGRDSDDNADDRAVHLDVVIPVMLAEPARRAADTAYMSGPDSRSARGNTGVARALGESWFVTLKDNR